MSSIPTTTSISAGVNRSWEKAVYSLKGAPEGFGNVMDAGYLRLNYARNTIMGSLVGKENTMDIYKLNVQSGGRMGINIKGGIDNGPVLKLTEEQLAAQEEAQKVIDEYERNKNPELWLLKEKQREEEAALAKANEKMIASEAPGLRIEVYIMQGGKPKLVADSHADKGSKERTNMDDMMLGDYKAAKGEYFVKVTRDDTVDKGAEVPYAIQTIIGKTYKHDYVVRKQITEDTSKVQNAGVILPGNNFRLSQSDILTIQASKYQATADMLAIGYLNMADIYNKTSKR